MCVWRWWRKQRRPSFQRVPATPGVLWPSRGSVIFRKRQGLSRLKSAEVDHINHRWCQVDLLIHIHINLENTWYYDNTNIQTLDSWETVCFALPVICELQKWCYLMSVICLLWFCLVCCQVSRCQVDCGVRKFVSVGSLAKSSLQWPSRVF